MGARIGFAACSSRSLISSRAFPCFPPTRHPPRRPRVAANSLPPADSALSHVTDSRLPSNPLSLSDLHLLDSQLRWLLPLPHRRPRPSAYRSVARNQSELRPSPSLKKAHTATIPMALFQTPAIAPTTISDARIPTLPPPLSTQRPLSPSLVSSLKTPNPTTSLFPSRNPLPPAPNAMIQKSGGTAGVQLKRKRRKLRGTLLPTWSGRTLEARHPPPRRLVEKHPRPDTPIDQTSRGSRPPGLTAPGQPDLEFMEMTLHRRSSVPLTNARSTT